MAEFGLLRTDNNNREGQDPPTLKYKEDKDMIKVENGVYRYYDKNGFEITEGCTIRYPSGRTEKVYRTWEGTLGIDATNPKWIESGRAAPCEMGVYPLSRGDCDMVEVIV